MNFLTNLLRSRTLAEIVLLNTILLVAGVIGAAVDGWQIRDAVWIGALVIGSIVNLFTCSSLEGGNRAAA
jgi:hypothetical protein